jgi:L-ascorbate metabolism protein UlaG (beta-lactamase superfamily)
MRIPVLILSAILIFSSVAGQDKKMIDQIREHKTGLAVWWIGQDSWIIKSGDLVISTDLFLQDEGRISPSPVNPHELAPILDIAFVTHGHGDHFEPYTNKILAAESKCKFVLPESCLDEAEKMKLPKDRIVVAKPRVHFEIDGIKVEPLRAMHGNSNFAIYYDANLQDCGYLFTIGGKRILQPGDTYLLEDHLFLKKVDVLFFSPTEHNMYIDNSVILINALDPEYIFPQHHSTVAVDESNRFWAKGYPDEVKIRLSKPLQERYFILKTGGMMEIK